MSGIDTVDQSPIITNQSQYLLVIGKHMRYAHAMRTAVSGQRSAIRECPRLKLLEVLK
ncbi:MAG: hypothetical protein F6K65_25740 [Moorea sp. SIO3C2]|nr:hypothetical protein [Moorena sp. SIO3C2]